LCEEEDQLFKHYSKEYFPPADAMVKYLSDFARRYNLKVKPGTTVVKVSKTDTFKIVDAQNNVYRCLRLIIATGLSRPYIPKISGIELAERYFDVTVDPDEFTNKKVLIIGKGNSGFETADNLIPNAASIHIASPHSIRMAWKSHYVGYLRALNNNFLDTYQLKLQNAVLDATIEKISYRNEKYSVLVNYTHANDEQEELFYDRVILCTGFRFDDSIFDDSCKPKLVINERFPDQTCEWESTNVERLYFAGTLMQMRDYGKTVSGFIHGFRYNIRALQHMLECKYHNGQWPFRSISSTPLELMNATIERINTSSALWQQFGFLCDLIVMQGDNADVRYYEEVPVNYISETAWGQIDHYRITLDYGPEKTYEDPFCANRINRHDTENSHLSNFLHPVIRHYSGSNLISEHHIIEDLASEWLEEEHTQPLLKYFSKQPICANATTMHDFIH